MPNFRAIKICGETTQPGNLATITNLQIGLNTPKSPYLNQATQKNRKFQIRTRMNETMDRSEKNCMSSNSKKCKELVIRKKSCTNVFTPVFGIPQTCQLSVLGLILQDNCRFDCHVHVKLIKANKCLFILRSLRKEGYSQAELDHLFSSIVLPGITYGLPVYGFSEAELTYKHIYIHT